MVIRKAGYKDIEAGAGDKLSYVFVRKSKELLRNDKALIRRYHKSACEMLKGIDYMNTTIGLKRKIFIALFERFPMLAKKYAGVVLR